MKGAFQTSREIFENPIWTDVIKFRIFFYIYGNAVFAKEGTRVGDIHLKRGQYLRSYRNLQKDLTYMEKRAFKTYSISTIESKIKQLVKENRIQIESTDYGTLFTVLNYEEYQGFERYQKSSSEQQPNSNRTATERHPNNNKNVNKDKNKDSLSPKDDQKEKVDYGKFIEWFNQKSGKRFKNVESNRKIIRARINEGYSKSELAKVVEFKSKQWKDDPKMNPYLRITTIFAPSHFGNYLNEANGYSKSSNISTTATSDGQRQGKTAEEITNKEQEHLKEIERRAREAKANNEHRD
ncbi:conserved phage C-terminal domain-containing protein [Pediococcus pentosaceus]|uniref:conserved phage C-terminal domain-containing protein n=1 Tax=Pediococcus pentosaceus TaxID=1255 RepID=UPI002B4C1739|nr:conserved phage C-terminal domain-containing protein [Pediococcus pentosaceus]MEB3376777.1 conserved phage C-terminal domain-containing protein [Pediococcus pentosaceus]